MNERLPSRRVTCKETCGGGAADSGTGEQARVVDDVAGPSPPPPDNPAARVENVAAGTHRAGEVLLQPHRVGGEREHDGAPVGEA